MQPVMLVRAHAQQKRKEAARARKPACESRCGVREHAAQCAWKVKEHCRRKDVLDAVQ